MKFANVSFALMLGAALAGTPCVGSAAGRGLLDSHCGCATQKGHIAQKGVYQKGVHQKGTCTSCVHQKGAIVQKGHVVQKGHAVQKGHIAQKGVACGGCGSCSICVPRVLPALINGIDHVLNTVFCCDSCSYSKGGHGVHQKGCSVCQKGHVVQKGHIAPKGIYQKGGVFQKSSGCGCGSDALPVAPSNPFEDDLQPPPIPEAESTTYNQWHHPKPIVRSTSHRELRVTTQQDEPRAISVETAEPISKKVHAKPIVARSNVVRTSNVTSTGLIIPKNPLR